MACCGVCWLSPLSDHLDCETSDRDGKRPWCEHYVELSLPIPRQGCFCACGWLLCRRGQGGAVPVGGVGGSGLRAGNHRAHTAVRSSRALHHQGLYDSEGGIICNCVDAYIQRHSDQGIGNAAGFVGWCSDHLASRSLDPVMGPLGITERRFVHTALGSVDRSRKEESEVPTPTAIRCASGTIPPRAHAQPKSLDATRGMQCIQVRFTGAKEGPATVFRRSLSCYCEACFCGKGDCLHVRDVGEWREDGFQFREPKEKAHARGLDYVRSLYDRDNIHWPRCNACACVEWCAPNSHRDRPRSDDQVATIKGVLLKDYRKRLSPDDIVTMFHKLRADRHHHESCDLCSKPS